MAKMMQTNLIQKHFEKFALGLTSLVFIIVVLNWVLHSPRSEAIPGIGSLGPAHIDAALLKLAQDVAVNVKDPNNKPPEQAIPQWTELLTERLSRPGNAPDPLTPLSLGRPPLAAGADSVQRKMPHPLPAPPALSDPVFTVNQELLRLPDQTALTGESIYTARDVYVARVSSVIDYAGFVQAWQKKLDEVAVPFRVIFFQVTAEREELLADGRWGNATTVTTSHRQPASSYTVWPQVPAYAGDLAGALMEVEAFAAASVQEEVLEPSFVPVYWREVGAWGTWRHRLPVTSVNQLPQAVVTAEHQPPGPNSPGAPSYTPYIPPAGPGGEYVPMVPPDVNGAAPNRPSGTMVLAAPARQPNNPPYMPPPGTNMPPTAASPRVVRPATPVSLPPVTPLPSLLDQCKAGIVQVWVHDASLEPAKTYRYRLKLELFNPVFGQTSSVEDPNDAQQLTLVSQSAWTAPVKTEPAAYYYVAGGGIGSISIEIFRNLMGGTFRQAISLKAGDPVGRTEIKEYINPDTGMVESRPVDFGTGSTLVDFDLNRTRDVGGVQRPVRQAVVQTADGQLISLEEQVGGIDPVRARLLKESQDTQRLINERKPPR